MSDGSKTSRGAGVQGAGALEELGARMDKASLRGQWQNETNRGGAFSWTGDMMLPEARGRPWLWPGDLIHGFLNDAINVLPESMTARRSVLCNNPGLARGTVATINMGIQMILPGEIAWAHRHSISALRFVIKGEHSLMTTVDGTGCPMETGDLVLTPGGTWHDHFNGSDAPLMWLDVLDGPVLSALNQTVFQNYGEKRQPVVCDASASGAGGGHLRYGWSDVERALEGRGAGEIDPGEGHVYAYLDARTGRDPMRTLGCRMHKFPAGFRGRAFTKRSNSVFHAFKGGGKAIVDDVVLEWKEGDCFAIPGWCQRTFEMAGDGGSYVFEVNDEPLLENLGLLSGDLSEKVGSVVGEKDAMGRS